MMFFCFIILYSVLMYGLSNLLIYGSGPFDILLVFRNVADKHIPMLGRMLKCMMCTSTNLGWLISIINIIFFPDLKFTPFMGFFNGDTELWLLIVIGDMLFTTGIVWLIHSFQDMCEKIANYYSNNEEDE